MAKGDIKLVVDLSLEDDEPEIDAYYWTEDHDPPPLIKPKKKKDDPEDKGRPGPQ